MIPWRQQCHSANPTLLSLVITVPVHHHPTVSPTIWHHLCHPTNIPNHQSTPIPAWSTSALVLLLLLAYFSSMSPKNRKKLAPLALYSCQGISFLKGFFSSMSATSTMFLMLCFLLYLILFQLHLPYQLFPRVYATIYPGLQYYQLLQSFLYQLQPILSTTLRPTTSSIHLCSVSITCMRIYMTDLQSPLMMRLKIHVHWHRAASTSPTTTMKMTRQYRSSPTASSVLSWKFWNFKLNGATHGLQFDVSLQRHEGRLILLSNGNYQSPRGTDKAPDFSPSVFQRLLRANERSCTVNLSIVMDNGYICSHNARRQRRSECPVPAGYHRLLQKVEPMAYGGNRIETVCVSISIITTFVLSLDTPASHDIALLWPCTPRRA